MNPVQRPLDESTAGSTPGPVAFRRLHALGRVGLRHDACLHLHRAWLDCRHCEDACPHASLQRGDGVVELDPARCTACGLCATRCPTGALVVEGYALAAAPSATAITVVCEKANANAAIGQAGGHRQRVPCLGGIEQNDWLQLALGGAGAPLLMIDDGSCTHCPTARGEGNPGLAALEDARRALAAAGVGADALPQRLIVIPLPNGNRDTANASAAPVAGRRAFFAGLSRAFSAGVAHAAAPAALRAATRTKSQPRNPVPNLRGDRTRVLLQQLAHLNGRSAPHEAQRPAVVASDACRTHGTCAHACPTSALALEDHTDYFVLRFDPWMCIDCAACARLCPEQALAHRPSAWRAFVSTTLELASTRQHNCAHCGAAIAMHLDAHDSQDEPALCDRCSKSRALARAGFALFKPAGCASPAAPDPP